MFGSKSARLTWIVGLSAVALVTATFAVVPFAAVSLRAFASGLGPALDPSQQPPATPPPGPSSAPVQVPGAASSTSPGELTQGVWLWQRSEYSNDTTVVAPDPSKYTIRFQPDGRLALQVDCNQGGGTYSQDGSGLTIEPGPTTLIACGPGSQDRVFLQDLRGVATYVFDGEDLVLNLKVDSGNMIFSPQPPVSLTGLSWRVQSYNNGRGGVVSVLPDVPLTLTFGDDGSISGNAGCNSYRGPYSLSSERLTFGSIVSTRRACLSDALTEQERAYLEVLSATRVYSLVGDRLTLRDDAGATQVVLARPSVQPEEESTEGAP